MTKDLIGESIPDGEANDILNKYFTCDFRPLGYKRYRGVTLPGSYSKFIDRIDNFEVRDDDVWVMSYPKTGTTWTQEMVWCIANNLDYEGAKQIIVERFPFLEYSSFIDFTDILAKTPDIDLPAFARDSVKFVDQIKSQRFIKTHLQWHLLPKQIQTGQKKPKIIYVCRNAKDTCMSYYHHCVILEGYKGSFEDFCTLFLTDTITCSPFWDHVAGFWENKHLPNVLFLKYEDMKKDLDSVVRKTAAFLGKSLKDDEVATLLHHLSFESMKKNDAVNYEAIIEINRSVNSVPEDAHFMRKGTGGEWKAKMTPEMIKRFDDWIQQNTVDKHLDIWSD